MNGEFIGGCDIIMSMAQSGELADFLEKEGALIPEEKDDVESADVKPNRK